MRISRFILFLIIVMLPLQGFAAEKVRTISVTGKSETILEAQYAIIYLKVKTLKKDMHQSYKELMSMVDELTRELKEGGLTDKDINKSMILQGLEYSWEKDSRVLQGYYSKCVMDMTVNDMSKVGDIYAMLSKYESIAILGTDFGRNDTFEIRQAEFGKALLAAREKAQLMAKTLDARIGTVYSIEELSSGNVFSIDPYSNVIGKASDTNNESYGNITITAAVTVEFELK